MAILKGKQLALKNGFKFGSFSDFLILKDKMDSNSPFSLCAFKRFFKPIYKPFFKPIFLPLQN